MKSKTEKILTVMTVLSWITCIGLLIKAGAILISFGVSITNPEGAKNLYMGLNLFQVREFSFEHYTLTVLLMAAIVLLEAYIAWLVIRTLSRIKLSNPFTMEVSHMLDKISYFILAIWVVVVIYNVHAQWLLKKMPGLRENHISGEFIFLAGVVFVFSQIFKKGVEIQAENELTV